MYRTLVLAMMLTAALVGQQTTTQGDDSAELATKCLSDAERCAAKKNFPAAAAFWGKAFNVSARSADPAAESEWDARLFDCGARIVDGLLTAPGARGRALAASMFDSLADLQQTVPRRRIEDTAGTLESLHQRLEALASGSGDRAKDAARAECLRWLARASDETAELDERAQAFTRADSYLSAWKEEESKDEADQQAHAQAAAELKKVQSTLLTAGQRRQADELFVQIERHRARFEEVELSYDERKEAFSLLDGPRQKLGELLSKLGNPETDQQRIRKFNDSVSRFKAACQNHEQKLTAAEDALRNATFTDGPAKQVYEAALDMNDFAAGYRIFEAYCSKYPNSKFPAIYDYRAELAKRLGQAEVARKDKLKSTADQLEVEKANEANASILTVAITILLFL